MLQDESKEILKRYDGTRDACIRTIERVLPFIKIIIRKYMLESASIIETCHKHYIHLEQWKELQQNLANVGDSTFPFLELPMEILEIILQCADYRSAQSLMCVSLGFKQRMKSIDVKGLLKSHFPRKYHVLDRHEQPASLGAIYWRDNS